MLLLPHAHSGLLRKPTCNWLELAVALGKGGPLGKGGFETGLSAAKILNRALGEVGLVREAIMMGKKELKMSR